MDSLPHIRRRLRCAMAACVLLATSAAGTTLADDQPLQTFKSSVAPVFARHCAECHNAKSRKADLDLSTVDGVIRGGESGALLVPGKPDDSLLMEMIESDSMPPEDRPRLKTTEIAAVRNWIAGLSGWDALQADGDASKPTQHDALPILYLRCTVCHGLREQQGGLDLRTRASILAGGKSGPAMVLGDPENSLLLKRVHAGDMPPRKLLIRAGVRPMEASEIETVTAWIAAGAPEADVLPDVASTAPDPLVSDEDREFWAFQTPRRLLPPRSSSRRTDRGALDAFVGRRLDELELTPSPKADRLTLLRRLAYDLTGLPVSWDDVDRAAADRAPDWLERATDRMLASPHYGERWGRHWLDAAGYADSEGKRSADPVRPHAWRYRDYVVRSFNANLSYDRFLVEQLAGDELFDYRNATGITHEQMEQLVATGFLRMAPDGTGSDIVNTVMERVEVVSDEIDILGSTVMGLTLKCAQCHSHKYDPIPQRDYYRLVAIFKGAYDEHDWLKPSFVPGQTKSKKPGRVLPYVASDIRSRWERGKTLHDAKVEQQKHALDEERQALCEKHLAARLKKAAPAELHAELRVMLETSKDDRDERQQQLAKKFEKQLAITEAELAKLEPDFAKKVKANDKQVQALVAAAPTEPMIRALWDRGTPSPTYIYRRGEYNNPGTLVGPGVPSVLTDGRTPFQVQPPLNNSNATGRRLAFANWLTQPDHPLTARVMVNRIWKHHFVTGLVKTIGNFGQTGSGVSHPELLDWLATEFVRSGWDIKSVHRRVLESRTWRQMSALRDRSLEIDEENRSLWRMPLQRRDAESVRDSLLVLAGELNVQPYGRPDPVDVRADGLVTSIGTDRGWRRSIYVQQRRREVLSILESFDLPQMNPNCVERPSSTVASQALHLWNNDLVRQWSEGFAQRVVGEVGFEPYLQVERIYQIAVGRQPTEEERLASVDTIRRLTAVFETEHAISETETNSDDAGRDARLNALAAVCHTVMNSAAFLYID